MKLLLKTGSMKKEILALILLSFLTSCVTTRKPVTYHISTLENIRTFQPTKEESRIIDSLKSEAITSLEKCVKIHGAACIDDVELMGLHEANFKGGNAKFRERIFQNFKIPKNAKKGENRFRVTIGKQDTIENVDILSYTDDNTKKEIERIFKLIELNAWVSAKVYRFPIKEEFEMSIFIDDKK